MKANKSSTFLRALLYSFFAITLSACGRSEQWTEEALLHDGRVIDVRRTVVFNFGSGELTYALKRWPDQFSLEATDPETGKRVKWSGERDINPILLDFVKGVPYLVVLSDSVYKYGAEYGCPDIPYAFLRYSDGHWVPIARSSAPDVLRTANLSMEYPQSWTGADTGRQSKQDIADTNARMESSSSQYYSVNIPDSFAAWPYRMKERFANTRYPNDCRPPVSEPVDAINPRSPSQPSTPVTLEVIETKSYDPPWSMSQDDWSRLTWNPKRSDKCKTLLGSAGQDNPRLDTYSAFIRNPSRVTRNAMWICDDDALWVTDYVAERDRVVLIKANAIGEVVYRISFKKPADSDPYSGGISQSSLREEGGYVYFDWWNGNQAGASWKVHRSLRVRVPVPST